MRKQVSFAVAQTVPRLQQDESLQRSGEADRTGTATEDTPGNIPPTPDTLEIPRSVTAAPYLKHASLTPAQRHFLYAIAASHSPARVRSLIARHYMNVLHRRVCTGNHRERDHLVEAASPEKESPSEAPPSSKPTGKLNRRSGKCFPSRLASRSLSSSASNRRKTKKTASPSRRTTSPGRDRIAPHGEEDEEEEEFELDDSLSDCLSSLSMAEWNDDTFSNL